MVFVMPVPVGHSRWYSGYLIRGACFYTGGGTGGAMPGSVKCQQWTSGHLGRDILYINEKDHATVFPPYFRCEESIRPKYE